MPFMVGYHRASLDGETTDTRTGYNEIICYICYRAVFTFNNGDKKISYNLNDRTKEIVNHYIEKHTAMYLVKMAGKRIEWNMAPNGSEMIEKGYMICCASGIK